jgi:hypothetical protein
MGFMNRVTVDQGRRVKLADCAAGDILNVDQIAEGTFVLKKVVSTAYSGIPLVEPIRLEGFLVAPTAPVKTIDYAKLMREEREGQ